MAQHGPYNSFFIVTGKNLSGDVYTLNHKTSQLIEQTNGLGTSWEEHKPVGIGVQELSAEGGLYRDDAAGLLAALQMSGASPSNQLALYGVEGSAVGAIVAVFEGLFAMAFERVSSKNGLTRANADYTLTGANRTAVLVSGFTARTADPGDSQSASQDQNLNRFAPSGAITSNSIANPTVVTTTLPHNLVTGDVVMIEGVVSSNPTINGERTVTVTGASTFTVPVNVTVAGTGGTFRKLTQTNGYVDLHVTALTLGGFTNIVVTPLHSADNVSFSTLGSAFTAVTAAGVAERVTVAGAIQRYRAVGWNYTGAGSGQTAQLVVAVSQ